MRHNGRVYVGYAGKRSVQRVIVVRFVVMKTRIVIKRRMITRLKLRLVIRGKLV